MAYLYYPGCKYTKHAPEKSKKLTEYLRERFDIGAAGCCSTDYKSLSSKDTAVYICPTCRAVLQECAPQAELISIWELLDGDDRFPWPDYAGRSVTVQDCWRTYDNRPMQDAVRSVLRRMNIQAVELEKAYDRADFCGVSLLKPQPARYERLAPKRFIEHAGDKFTPCTQEEQIKQMREHCSQVLTDAVVCYCTGCLEGLQIGGAHGVHLMDLVIPAG